MLNTHIDILSDFIQHPGYCFSCITVCCVLQLLESGDVYTIVGSLREKSSWRSHIIVRSDPVQPGATLCTLIDRCLDVGATDYSWLTVRLPDPSL